MPILPVEFNSSEIDRATYLTINPERNEMSFVQSGDTDTIVLEHDDVEGTTIEVTINGKSYLGWTFDNTTNPNQITWTTNVIKNGDTVEVTYVRQTIPV